MNSAHPINVSEPGSDNTILVSTEHGLHGLVDLFGQYAGLAPVRHRGEVTVGVPTNLGSGHLSYLTLPDDIQIGLFHVCCEHETLIRFHEKDAEGVFINAQLTGKMGVRFDETAEYHLLTDGEFICYVESDGVAELSVPARAQISFVHLRLPESYADHFGYLTANTPNSATSCPSKQWAIRKMGSVGMRCLRSMMNLRLNSPTRKFRMYADIYQVLADASRKLERDHQRVDRAVSLTYRDVEQILRAREYLVTQLQQAPSIPVLAKEVGINQQKLKGGFKHLFGTTINQYLRECRLEKARQLMEKGNRNLRDVASQVGYVNQSHFADRFRQQFGMLPRDYLKSFQR